MLCYFSGKQMNHVVAIGALCIFIKQSVFFLIFVEVMMVN